MLSIIRHLVLGADCSQGSVPSPIGKSFDNLRVIWTSKHSRDIGIERIIRLLLAASVFLLPGVYFKQSLSGLRSDWQDIVTDVYVLFKVAYPACVLYAGAQNHPVAFSLAVVLIAETMLYIPLLIFASDVYHKPRTYRRSLLLLFVNYVELIIGFAVLYSLSGTMNRPFMSVTEAVYFSAVTASTIGYGDLYPVTDYGRIVVTMQSMAFLVFGVLFLSFYTNRIEHVGYFGGKGFASQNMNESKSEGSHAK